MLYGWHAGEWSKPFSLSITPFTLKMLTKHTKLVELHLDDIRRVVLLNISLFPIAMSACGLRKPQLKATRQSYNPHWQPRDQPVLNWTVCYSACNSFQVTITHPQVDFSLFQREKKETWQMRAVSPTNHQLFLALLLAPPKKWLFSPRRYRWLFSKGLVCMLSGLNCSTMASSEGIQDSMRWQLDRSTQPPPPCAVSMSFMAWQAREVEKFVPCGKRKKNQGWGLWRNEKTSFI